MAAPQDWVTQIVPDTIQKWPAFPELSTSVLLVVLLLLARLALVKLVRGKDVLLSSEQRRWISRIKNSVWIIVFLGLVLIWAPELRTLALSLTAVAAALVLAGKELLLCFSGALMRTVTQPFKVGDWITIDGVTGVVVDLDALAIQLEEIDVQGRTYQLTGRRLQVPNAKLLTHTVINEHAVKRYTYHSFQINVAVNDAPEPSLALAALKQIVERFYEPVASDAAAATELIERTVGLDLPEAEPEITFRTHDFGHHCFTIRLFVPSRHATMLASSITIAFLQHLPTLPAWRPAARVPVAQGKSGNVDVSDE